MTNGRELVERLKSGDEVAWRQFMKEYGGLILLVARRMGLSPSDQEEVFQGTCVLIYRHIRKLRDSNRLGSWVHRIAHRTSLDLVTHRHRREISRSDIENLIEFTPATPVEPEIERTIARYELAREIRAHLGQLNERCRRLISALYLEDPPWSYQRICRELDMPVGSIGPTRARCLDRLRKLLVGASNRDQVSSSTWKAEAALDVRTAPSKEQSSQ